MEIIAVVIGYLLGVAPFTIPKLIELFRNRVKEEKNIQEEKEQTEIFDEWLNGPKKEVNQEDIYKEYITGEITKGE